MAPRPHRLQQRLVKGPGVIIGPVGGAVAEQFKNLRVGVITPVGLGHQLLEKLRAGFGHRGQGGRLGGAGQGRKNAAMTGGSQLNLSQPVQESAALAGIPGGYRLHESGDAQIAGAGHFARGGDDAVEGRRQQVALFVAQNCVGTRHYEHFPLI